MSEFCYCACHTPTAWCYCCLGVALSVSELLLCLPHANCLLVPFLPRSGLSVSEFCSVKVKGKVHPIQATKGFGWSGGIALLFIYLGARRGGWSAPRPDRFTPGKDPVPIIQETGWAPGPVWTCAKNLAPTGIRSSDRPARSQWLYRLSHPAHCSVKGLKFIKRGAVLF
jgi:hypothetical protein